MQDGSINTVIEIPDGHVSMRALKTSNSELICSVSPSKTSSSSSLVGCGYWEMVEDWVDSSCAGLESDLMLLSGNDFKAAALKQYAANDASSFDEGDADSETEDANVAEWEPSSSCVEWDRCSGVGSPRNRFRRYVMESIVGCAVHL